MNPLNNQPLRDAFLKKIANTCISILDRIAGKIADRLSQSILKDLYAAPAVLQNILRRLGQFLNSIPHYLLGCCVILALVLAGQQTIHHPSNHPNTTNAVTNLEAITLTLEDDEVITIQSQPATDAPCLKLKADSLFQVRKGDIHCNGLATLKVPVGFLPVQLELPDGSRVHLNAGSTLRYPPCFASDKRQVQLSGEAYFEIAPDAQRIFSVQTKDLTIKVVGTSFCVNSYRDNDKSQISLVEGGVLVISGNKEKYLRPGLAAVLNKQNYELSTTTFDPRLVLCWRNGMYYFDSEPLETICKTATRMYGNTIIIDDEILARRRFSGSINRLQPLQAFLNYIKDIADVQHYYDKKGQLHLR